MSPTPEPARDPENWTVVGSVGGPGFGVLDARGRLTNAAPRGIDRWALDWWIGADDGWHVPSGRGARQRLASPGVIETRVKVPSGDAIQRVYGVGGAGDLVVVEIENDSPLPFGVAFGLHGAPPLVFPREPFPLDGPPGECDSAVHLPVAHRTSIRIAVPLSRRTEVDVTRLPSVEEVERGWRAHLDAGMRIDVPDAVLMHAVDAARAHLLLFDDGVQPIPAPMTGASGPTDAALIIAALVGWGHASHAAELRPSVPRRLLKTAPPITEPVDAFLRQASPTITWGRGGEAHHGARTAEFLLSVRDFLLTKSAAGVDLLPTLPPSWRGGGVEVHDAPLSNGSQVSFAIRWHDDRPALIWTVEGSAVRLTAPALDPSWSTTEPRGEALLGP